MAEAARKSGGCLERKFARPPVKVACLPCRKARTRCDGARPCANCQGPGKQCIYLPSKRGGARARRKHLTDNDGPPCPGPGLEQLPSQQEALPLGSFMNAGAGLDQLPAWTQDSELLFDSLFAAPSVHNISTPDLPTGLSGTINLIDPIPMVRAYGDDRSLLDAYYVFIHPYFPILPPPEGTPLDRAWPRFRTHAESFEEGYEPASPAALAIAAILALLPCQGDANHNRSETILFRRKYAHYLSQLAVETIEAESDLPASSTDPAKALEEPLDRAPRTPFHEKVPQELEAIIALDLLCVYEYVQRGNIRKMQSRSGQALMTAMSMSLHTSSGEDQFQDARCRAWWLTYACVAQSAVVNNANPPLDILSLHCTTGFPCLRSDPRAFPAFLQGQQAILRTTLSVIELRTATSVDADLEPIYEKMRGLEAILEPLIAQSDAWVLGSSATSPVDEAEAVVARALRCIARIKLNSARIKLHRSCAFFDTPIFSAQHCDLEAKPEGSEQDPFADDCRPVCPHSLPGPDITGPSVASQTPTSTRLSAGSTSSPPEGPGMAPNQFVGPSLNHGPFSSHQSSRVSLQSALNVARAYEDLPYPNPSGRPVESPCLLSMTPPVTAPRTMPAFACSAMQCAYVLLMVRDRTRAAYPDGGSRTAVAPLVDSLTSILTKGLETVYATLDNYALAFEALGGMRDQIRDAMDAAPVGA